MLNVAEGQRAPGAKRSGCGLCRAPPRAPGRLTLQAHPGEGAQVTGQRAPVSCGQPREGCWVPTPRHRGDTRAREEEGPRASRGRREAEASACPPCLPCPPRGPHTWRLGLAWRRRWGFREGLFVPRFGVALWWVPSGRCGVGGPGWHRARAGRGTGHGEELPPSCCLALGGGWGLAEPESSTARRELAPFQGQGHRGQQISHLR